MTMAMFSFLASFFLAGAETSIFTKEKGVANVDEGKKVEIKGVELFVVEQMPLFYTRVRGRNEQRPWSRRLTKQLL